MNRTQRIFLELEKTNLLLEKRETNLELEKRNLHLPKYETTKGTDKWAQARAIEGYAKLLEDQNKENCDISFESDDNRNPVYSDGSSDDYVPSVSSVETQCSSKSYLTRNKKRVKGWHTIAENITSNDSLNLEENIEVSSTIPITNGSLESEVKEIIHVTDISSSSRRRDNNGCPQIEDKTIQIADISSSSASQEDTISCDTEPTERYVHICNSSKSVSGKRIRDKRHACYFCSRTVIHMSRHLELLHKNEIEIVKLMAMPKNSVGRKNGFLELMRVGDFYHNCNILSARRGELILVRRPNKNEVKTVTYVNYGPCPYCLGYMLKKHIWHHVKTMCPKKPKDFDFESGVPRHVIAESNSLQSSAVIGELDTNFIRSIVEHLRDDNIGTYCKEDRLILRFGYMMFEKYGLTQSDLIRQNMRQLSRLTLELKTHCVQQCTLVDFLKPEKFDLIIECTKKVARIIPSEVSKRAEFGTPSLALKLGHNLRKCIGIERGIALRKGDLRKNDLFLSLLSLMELEWSTRISSNALSTLYNRKLSGSQLLPITSDLKCVNRYIETEMNKAISALKLSCNISKWSRLATLVLCRIMLFNKRRSGESSRITISQFLKRPSYKESTEELKQSLSPYERKLAEQLTIVKAKGKKGRHVAVLLTTSLKSSIDLLICTRGECGIAENNPFIFARSGQSTMHLRGHDCLRKIVGEINMSLKRPDLISGTQLRKYVATVSQLFCLKENEMDWLARHLGHDLSVHREFYRLQEDAVELTKISRLLLAVDEGQAQKFAGKSLEDINIEDLPDLEEENTETQDDVMENNSTDESEIQRKKSCYKDNKEQDANSSGLPNGANKSKWTSDTKERSVPKNVTEKRKSSKGKHVKWEAGEKEVVLNFFKNEIKKNILPGKSRCEEALNKFPVLNNRKWTDIKFCIKNHMTKIHRNNSN